MGGGAEWEERTLSKLIRQVGELPVVYVLEHNLCYHAIRVFQACYLMVRFHKEMIM